MSPNITLTSHSPLLSASPSHSSARHPQTKGSKTAQSASAERYYRAPKKSVNRPANAELLHLAQAATRATNSSARDIDGFTAKCMRYWTTTILWLSDAVQRLRNLVASAYRAIWSPNWRGPQPTHAYPPAHGASKQSYAENSRPPCASLGKLQRASKAEQERTFLNYESGIMPWTASFTNETQFD